MLMLFIGFHVKAENSVVKDTALYQLPLEKQRDIEDVFRHHPKNNLPLHTDSVVRKSLGPYNSIFLYPGYALVTNFQAVFTGNISFYTDTLSQRKISSLLLNSLYTANHQWIEIANSNIWTPHNRFNLLGDWRFYRFPSYTFGLGSKSDLSKSVKIDYSYVRLYEVVMTKVAKNIDVGMGYNLDEHYNITEQQNDSVSGIYGMDKYGFKTKTVASGITANVQFRDNLMALGSDNNWTSMVIDWRFYLPFPKRSGNVLAFWRYEWITLSGNPPYLCLPSNGWDTYNNTGRGFVEGRFRGRNMVYSEAEYRFKILRNGLLGGVVFVNASSFSEPIINRFQQINIGKGIGLRIKINKKSNTNFVIDYGFGTQGSQGFSFNLNEVF